MEAHILFELYITQKKTLVEISQIYNISTYELTKLLYKYNIPCKRKFIRSDISGRKFHDLVVIKLKEYKRHTSIWECRCKCGNIVDVHKSSLIRGDTKSCGCRHKYSHFSRRIDYKLILLHNCTIIKELASIKNRRMFECLCKCGVIFTTSYCSLKRNSSISCGCSKRYKRSIKYFPYEEITANYWRQFLNNAKMRLIPVDITQEDVWNMYIKNNKRCCLSGLEITFIRNPNQTASIDRIDHSLGYTKENIQIVHKDINLMKNVFSKEYFISLCNKVTLYQNNKMEILSNNTP